MLWPQPFNIRMNPFRASQLLDAIDICTHEEREISDFPEYAYNLNGNQSKALDVIARQIVRSHSTHSQIAAVTVIGHADVALREPTHLREKKELQVSQDRANTAEKLLIEAIRKVIPDGARVAAMINTKAIAKGSSERRFKNPITEAEMKKNRRVAFKWARCHIEGPLFHPLIITPPQPLGGSGDNPNAVFAGNHFKFKILSGFSMGEIGGVCSYTIAVWDVDNKRSAVYDYFGVVLTVGVPISESGEGDWTEVITTSKFVQVDQFFGPGTHEAGSLIIGKMSVTFLGDFVPSGSLGKGLTIWFPSGFSKSIGLESGKGSISLTPGSVKVFKGP
jgi:outer membrane protein OmpA-like peptidoglycan-associated protein